MVIGNSIDNTNPTNLQFANVKDEICIIIKIKTCLTAGFTILNQKLLDMLFSKATRSDGMIEYFQMNSFSNLQINLFSN